MAKKIVKLCCDSPIQTELNLSVGAVIRILVFFGEFECVFTSDNNLSPKPGNNVVPPERTIWENSILRKSKSVFMIELTKISWMPGEKGSEQWKR